ncbi:MAG: hypothetical protein IJD91_01290 [Clostridia bacterium]|nr:hypothetical protein [Clostridia bacterium]
MNLLKKKKPIGENEIKEAYSVLQKYKRGKANLEKRIIEEELYWKRRQWDYSKDGEGISSAWMFNAIINRHADLQDSYPEAVMLPREKSDEESAKVLSSVIPVILEQNGFRKTYSDAMWYKLKHGCVAYGVFWNGSAEGGKGCVETKYLDLLNIFWEPCVTDIQKSRNLFICDLVATDELKERYPKIDIKGTDTGELSKYVHDENIDTSDKVLVVDWYYKRNGILHYCKFCEGNILFASENEKGYENGWYEDGEYPVVFDVLYPEEGTPVGFGVIAITKEPQTYIDKLDAGILRHTYLSSHPRYFAKRDMGINKDEFLDVKNAIIEVDGNIDEERLKQIKPPEISSALFQHRTNKIDELKETAGNTDFTQGRVSQGVTSGAAIATLQEAGNKLSRDIIESGNEAYKNVILMIIERLRQFYTIERVYRITQPNDKGNEFVTFDNSAIVPQKIEGAGGEDLFRVPIFDIAVESQKKNPFSTLAQNETAMNLYNAGFFNPEMAQQSLMALKLMTFEGRNEVIAYVQEGQTLHNQMQQMEQQMQMLMQENAMLKGVRRDVRDSSLRSE